MIVGHHHMRITALGRLGATTLCVAIIHDDKLLGGGGLKTGEPLCFNVLVYYSFI